MLLSVGKFAVPTERRKVIKLIKREPTGTISVLNPPVGASAIDGRFLLWYLLVSRNVEERKGLG